MNKEELEELYDEGHRLCEICEYELAFDIYMKGAEAGHVYSMSALALMYSDGDGVKRDFDKSIEWDRKAYDAGDKTSLHNMAITYRMKGRMLNYKYWLEQSLKEGEGGAALDLAKLYMISDKERDNVIKYLEITLSHEDMTEGEIEEAEMLLAEM
jgi:TPR repeat protein